MLSKLTELKLHLPTIDLLESRKLTGGTSYEGPFPIDPIEVYPEVPWNPREDDDRDPYPDPENSPDPGPGAYPDPGSEGHNGGNSSTGPNYGNPGDPSGFPEGVIQPDPSACVATALQQILAYMNIFLTISEIESRLVNAGITNELALLLGGIQSGQISDAMGLFIENNQLGSYADLNDALSNNNAVLAVINNGDGEGHAVVIVGGNSVSGYDAYDPATGQISNIGTPDIESAFEAVNLNGQFREEMEQKWDFDNTNTETPAGGYEITHY